MTVKSVRLEEETHTMLKVLSAKKGMTINELLRYLMEKEENGR